MPGYDLLEQKVHIFSTTGTPADTTCIETIYRLNMSLASNASMLFAYKDASTIDFYDNYYVNGYKLSKAASVPGTSKDYILNTSRDCKDYLQVLESKPAVAKLFYLTRDINNDAGNENNGEIGFHHYGNNIFPDMWTVSDFKKHFTEELNSEEKLAFCAAGPGILIAIWIIIVFLSK